jgi:hypothetical protein
MLWQLRHKKRIFAAFALFERLPDFQTKNPNLGKFWRALDWKMLIYVKAIWNTFGHLGHFMSFWYILCPFGTFFLVWYCAPRKIWQPCAVWSCRVLLVMTHLQSITDCRPSVSIFCRANERDLGSKWLFSFSFISLYLSNSFAVASILQFLLSLGTSADKKCWPTQSRFCPG